MVAAFGAVVAPQAGHRDTGSGRGSAGPNQHWALDFVADALSWGRRFRVPAVVDDFTREAPALVVDTSIGDARVVRELDAIIAAAASRR